MASSKSVFIFLLHEQYKASSKLLSSRSKSGQPLVFISDGGVWMKNWIEDAYPKAILVLDFWHALKHLYDYAKAVIKEENYRKKWVEEREELLLNGEVQKIIDELSSTAAVSADAKKLMDYYASNKMRMDYLGYKKLGAGLIGSGAIESAHRTVVQKRMKQSGQRWGRKGAQNMLNLRVTNKNHRH